MVQASIDNTPISITLGQGESTTVPTGETWRITVKIAGNSSGHLKINGVNVAYADQSDAPHDEIETVVTGGDTIATTAYALGHIGGFKV